MNTMLRTRSGYLAHASLSRSTFLATTLWVLSPTNVQVVRAAQVCSQNSSGETICHNKLSVGVIAAIVVTITLVLLLCIGIFFYIRRSRVHTSDLRSANWAHHFGQNSLRYGSRSRSAASDARYDKDEEAAIGDDKYMTEGQAQGPTWEARYDPSSAPALGGWGSRFGRGLRKKYENAPASAPGGKKSIASADAGGRAKSASTEKSSGSTSPSGSKGGKRNWGNIIHNQLGSQARSTGSRSAPSTDPVGARSRKSPGLYLADDGGFAFSNDSSNASKIPPLSSPRTPRHPHAPIQPSPLNPTPRTPLSPRTPMTARELLTPRAAAAASFVPPAPPMTPRQAVLIQSAFETGMIDKGLRV